MIIVITNRSLPTIPQSASVEVSVKKLGVELGARVDNKNRIYTGEFLPEQDGDPQYKKLTFQPKGKEGVIFDKINDTELSKPWVFFVHGFHQDPTENLDKAIALQDNHNVNVVVFAWPSRPLDKTYSLEDAKQTIVQDAITGVLGKRTLLMMGKDFLLGAIKDTWYNYPPAIANAEKSHGDLFAAMNLINEKLKLTQAPVLLIHSMGNYLLENALKHLAALPVKFSNIVLHQADATVPGMQWITQLNASLATDRSRLYLTSNIDDYVLLSSKARRVALKLMGELPSNASTERMGRYIENHVQGNIHYIDFSEGVDIEEEHEFFKLAKSKTNPYVHGLLGRIFRAESDTLPVDNSTSNGGFSKMPAEHNLYKLEEVIHLVDLVDGTDIDDIVPVKSLNLYNDHYDSDLNGEDFED